MYSARSSTACRRNRSATAWRRLGARYWLKARNRESTRLNPGSASCARPGFKYNTAVTIRSIAAVIFAATAGFTCAPPAAAQGTPVRVLVSNGMKAALQELQPQCERAIGHSLDLQFNSTASVKQKIEAGEAFDVTIISMEAIDDLIKQGRLAGSSRAGIARSKLGIGIRVGTLKPDIHTPERLKQALRDVKSITYPQDGATRGYIEKMFERLGIAADVMPKTILAPGSGAATESVASGNATFVITLFSEIVPVRGIEILGALPGKFQYDLHFGAAASAKTENAVAAHALIGFLVGPEAARTFKTKGLEPR
jgi:molybdate transport system substrate-binding protein